MQPRLITTHFQEVGFTAAKTGTCPACGKPARREKRFFQTLNPFNKNERGEPKTVSEIFASLRPAARAWKAEPCYHARCED